MTLPRSAARVFTGILSNLSVTDGVVSALLAHTVRDRAVSSRITISADVALRLDGLAEGPVALYGALSQNHLTVLGPDLRRKTLAALRPRGDMGPPAPQVIEGVISNLAFHTAKVTGKLYLKARFAYATEDGTVEKTLLVRHPLSEALATELGDGVATLRCLLVDDTLEVLALVTPAPAPVETVEDVAAVTVEAAAEGAGEAEAKTPAKRALTREQKDARNARARERRAASKAAGE